MLLLLLDSLLLVFITVSTGSISRHLLSRLFKTAIQSSFIEDFFFGLIFSAIYFSIVSLFAPANYLVLIPLLIISIYWQWKVKWVTFYRTGNYFSDFLKDNSTRYLFILLLILIGVYFLIPPINHDSADYHYQAVYWYETHKVIPGLGNVHGRLAFNAATFILSAPYSFSNILSQSLYPLNGVIVLLFYLWLFKKIIARRANFSSIVYLITAIFLLRPLLANIPSPASEPLVTITVAFVFLKLIEVIENNTYHNPAVLLIPFFVSVFAVTAKLTSLPILVVPLVWVLFFVQKQKTAFYIKGSVIILIIITPWLIRNVILSGYLIYPLYQLDLFNFDWKVPKSVAVLDYALGTYGSKGEINKGLLLQNEYEWFLPWIKNHRQPKKIIDFIVLVLCFISPLTWFIFRKRNTADKSMVVLWLCAFTCLLVWLFRAPEYRFGMSFLLVTFCIPMVECTKRIQICRATFSKLSAIFFTLAFCYYILRGMILHPRLHSNGIEMLWLKPLKDQRYYKPVNMATFRYDDLGHGVRLYYKDNLHDNIFIRDQPCMLWYYGKIEMRGSKIDDGFRNVTDEVYKTVPWLFVRKW